MKSYIAKFVLILSSFLLPSQAYGEIALTITSPLPTPGPGDVVDAFDADNTPTTYGGSWIESTSGANGFWSADFTDTSPSGVSTFVSAPRIVDLPTISDGQGIQFNFDSNTGSTGPDRESLVSFSYSVTSLGTASATDFGSAIAVGPEGSGFNDNGGGIITDDAGNMIAAGTIFDGPAIGAPIYDASTGSLDSSPATGTDSSSRNHDWTIFFAGQTSVLRTGTFNDTDTIVFGIGSTVAAVPEPSSTALLALSGALVMFRRRR